jgi:hypothetical protein
MSQPSQQQQHIPEANQFDVIRSYSKDKFYRLKQTSLLKICLEHFFKKQLLLKLNSEIELVSDLFYYTTTTGLNKQTIGQEYFNLILFNNKTLKPLTKSDRTKLILLKLVAPYLINFIVRSKSSKYSYNMGLFRILVLFAERLNRILFLFTNTFYSIDNLLTRTKIASLNLIDKTSLKTLKFIGIIKIATFLIQIYNESKFLKSQLDNNSSPMTIDQSDNDSEKSLKTNETHSFDNLTCLLCLDKTNEPTSAMCGHIFCYACIQAFVNNSKKSSTQTTCPSCRMVINENKLIYLHNF